MGEFGSVTTMIREVLSILACSNACSKILFCESVSTVEPDLDETTTTVFAMSFDTADRTRDG